MKKDGCSQSARSKQAENRNFSAEEAKSRTSDLIIPLNVQCMISKRVTPRSPWSTRISLHRLAVWKLAATEVPWHRPQHSSPDRHCWIPLGAALKPYTTAILLCQFTDFRFLHGFHPVVLVTTQSIHSASSSSMHTSDAFIFPLSGGYTCKHRQVLLGELNPSWCKDTPALLLSAHLFLLTKFQKQNLLGCSQTQVICVTVKKVWLLDTSIKHGQYPKQTLPLLTWSYVLCVCPRLSANLTNDSNLPNVKAKPRILFFLASSPHGPVLKSDYRF